MAFGLFLLFVIWVLWALLVRGFLFKFILFIFGWVGIYLFRGSSYPATNAIAIDSLGLSWAALVPTVICFLALLTTRSE